MGGLAASIGLGASVKLASNEDDDGSGGGGGGGGTTGVIGKFTGAVLTGESPQHGYLADAGEANTITAEPNPQLYPTAARTFSAMRVTATGGGSATLSDYTVTLYKNGVATAQQVTIPSLTAPGTVVADLAHPIAFAANDKFDVRWDIQSGDGSALNLAVVLEGTGGAGGGGGGGGPVGSAITGLTFPIVAGTPTLTAGAIVELPQNLTVDGNLTAHGTGEIDGAVTINGGATINAGATVNGTLNSNGGVDVASGALIAGAGVPTTLHDTLQVDGAATINGGATINAGATVNGTLTSNGGVDVASGALVADAGVPTTLHDTLQVDGAATINGGATINAGATINGAVVISGSASLNGQAVTTDASVAAWTLGAAGRRVFLVDGVNGNDANAGFLDGGNAVFPISGATIAATAKKTLAALAACFPLDLQGRIFELIIAAGTYTDGLQAFMSTLANVPAGCVVRGTVTNATASSTAFAGTAADAVMAGYVTATGMFANGYNPTGAPTNHVIQCLQVGGGAPAFAAEPARPLGARIRFDSATTTAALRNICRQIAQVTGTDTLTLNNFFAGQNLPAVPVASDVFYIEEPGVIVGATTIGNDSGPGQELQIVGVKSTGAIVPRFGGFLLVGVGAASISPASCRNIASATSYTHPSLGTVISGGGARIEGGASYTICALDLSNFVIVGRVTLADSDRCTSNSSFVVGAGLVYNGNRGLSAQSTGIGVTVAISPVGRIIGPVSGGTEGGLNLRDTSIQIDQLQVTNAGAAPAVRIENQTYCFLVGTPPGVPPITGSSGNTDVGFDLTLARGSVIVIDPSVAPTITGSLGDVRLAGNVIISWATLIAGKGIVDIAGNRIVIGNSAVVSPVGFSVGPVYIVGKFGGAILTSAIGATSSYLADGGSALAVANLATPQRYPTSQRLITKLRVSVVALSGALANASTATLYKTTGGGAATATAMQVSIPAGSAVGFGAVDTAHSVLFSDGDTFDVRLDDASDASAGTMTVSATLEGP